MEQQQPASAPPPPYPAPAYGPADAPLNVLSIVSLVLGLMSFVFALGPLAGIPAIITGYIARHQIERSGESGAGPALWGIVLGYVNVGLAALALTVGVIAALYFALSHH